MEHYVFVQVCNKLQDNNNKQAEWMWASLNNNNND